MNLSSMLSDLYRRLKFSTTPDPVVTTRLTAFINESQREVMGMKGYAALRRNIITFSCVANTPFVSIPESVERIVTVQDRTNQAVLDEVDIQTIRFQDPGLTATSTFPYQYAIVNYSAAVSQDPSVAAQIWVKSDSASDGSTITAFIEGYVTGGYYQRASVALNGTTAVQVGSLATWTAITKFYLSLTAGGTVTATGNIKLMQTSGAGTQLAQIPPGYDYARYLRLHLYPVPTQINNYTADVELHIEDMVQLGDEPYLPEDFHWLLESGALVKEYQYKENLQLESAELARWRNGLADLRMYLVRRTGAAHDTTRGRRWSQLGGNFPVGS